MHILVIPSEEYLSALSPLAGIFQKHQISVLKEKSNYQLGVISVRLKLSIIMIMRAILYRLFARRVDNELRGFSIFELIKLAIDKLFFREKFLSISLEEKVNIARIEGLYFFPPSAKWNHYSWVKSGLSAYEAYVYQFGSPDIIHAHNALNAGFLAYEIKRRHKINYVLTEHSSYYYQGLVPKQLFSKVARVIASAACFTVVSPRLKNVLLDTIGRVAEMAICLPNVLPPSYERQLSKTPINTGKFVFLSVGNLLPIKGHDIVIRAFARLKKWPNNAVLKIVGDGPERDKLETLADKLGVLEKIEFVGEVDSEAVRNYMLDADVFVFPSQFETFGVVLIEAMSCGLPVISTACGGPESIVNDETGILVKPQSVNEMQAGMMWAIDNVGKMHAADIRKSAINRYGGSQFFDKISQIYERVFYLNEIKSG